MNSDNNEITNKHDSFLNGDSSNNGISLNKDVPSNNSNCPDNNLSHYTWPDKPVIANSIPKENSNLAVYSLVLGILSLLVFFAPILGLIVNISGIVTGTKSLIKNLPYQGMAILGIILSVIGLLLSLVAALIWYFSI